MSDPRFDFARRIAAEVLNVSAGQRAALLAQRCGTDTELRREVERMVRSHESATIMDGAKGDAAVVSATLPPDADTSEQQSGSSGATNGSPASASASASKRFGNYTILETLGEGGMGVVYLAEQDRPRRVVALKVIRPGAMTPRMLRRFEIETQMLGRLQHAGIAQVYDAGVAGTADGGVQPFFAMEYVRGVPLSEYATNHALDARERIELFIRVCEAVQHAHQKGVIHRDLKPGNILVDSAGQPKVLDFGVARATDSDTNGATLQTEVGQLVGTIPYMSPEQISGDPAELDTRSDVYTLGVILYELLTGRLPHQVTGKTIVEAARLIGEQAITPLGSINRTYRGELQTIVSKALERDKARRYQSATEFSGDLNRFLLDEPIQARPPSRTYLLQKFAKRNRGLVVGSGVAAMLLIAGALGTGWQAVRATKGWERAKDETENAEATVAFLTDMLANADPDNAVGRDITVREVLDETSRSIDHEFQSRPRVEWAVRKTLAETYRGIDALDVAEKHARRSLELAEKEFGKDDLRTMLSERVLVGVLANAGKLEESTKLAEHGLETAKRVFGTEHRQTCLAMGEVARGYQETGRIKEATSMMREAVAIGQRVCTDTDQEFLVIMHNLGTSLKDGGDLREAEALLRRIVDARAKIHGRDHPQTAYSINSLAAALQKMDRNDDAIELMREALRIREKTQGPLHQATLTSKMNLAGCLVSLKRLDEAEPIMRDALAGYETTLGKEHAKTLVGMSNLAYLLEDQGHLEDAEQLNRQIVEIRRKTGTKDPETWSAINNLAMLLLKKKEYVESETLFKELLSLCEANLPADHYYTAMFRDNYGDLLRELQRNDEAERELLTSRKVMEKVFPAEHPRMVRNAKRLVSLYEQMGQPDKARAVESLIAAQPRK